MTGRLWCRDLRQVTVPATTPKPVTVIYPYYDCPTFFAQQVTGWAAYPPSVTGYLSIIVVDDGSSVPAVKPCIDGLDIRLYRIEQDVRWNWLAARNIGAYHAGDGWLLLTDMDHVIPIETIASVILGQHDPEVVYGFSRREHTGARVHPHSASFLMTRKLFWRIGGYDERLSGHYGTDGEYRRRIVQHAPIQILSDVLVRHEYVADSSTTRYQRKQPQDRAVKQLIAQRKPGWTPLVRSFPYHEVTA